MAAFPQKGYTYWDFETRVHASAQGQLKDFPSKLSNILS